MTLTAIVTVVLIYQVRFTGMYLQLYAHMFGVVFGNAPIQNYLNFLHGQLKVGGWWNYFLVAFLIKSTVPFYW